jgi:hypothetical protein
MNFKSSLPITEFDCIFKRKELSIKHQIVSGIKVCLQIIKRVEKRTSSSLVSKNLELIQGCHKILDKTLVPQFFDNRK